MIVARFRQFGRAVEHAQTFRAIAGIFLKYGYDDLARHLPLPRFWLRVRTRRLGAALLVSMIRHGRM